MPFPVALDTDDYVLLRGEDDTTRHYEAEQYVSLCSNTVVFEARVNGTPTGASFAQVTFDTVTTGVYTDLQEGMTVLISSTTNLRTAEFRGRMRKTPTSTILYINETSVPILDNWYITVLDDYAIWDKLARDVSGTQYKDYDLTFAQLKPVIYGLQSAYVAVADPDTDVATIDFAALAFAGTSGATISSWTNDVVDGSRTSGSNTSQNITVEFPPGERWVKFTATDSGGRVATFRCWVNVVPSDFSSGVSLDFDGASLNADDSGWGGTITAFAGVSDVLDNTLIVVWEIERYLETEGSILSTVKFVGRLRKETNATTSDEEFSQLQETRFELEGIAAQISRIEHLPFTLTTKAAPTKWDEIKNMTMWRAVVHSLQRHTTLLELHALSFDNVADTFAYPALPTQGGNILAIVSDIMDSINAAIEFAPTGEMEIGRKAVYLTSSERDALPTIADFTLDDVIDFSLEIEHVKTIGKVDASGGSYSSSTGKVNGPYLSIAPGLAQNSPEGTAQLHRQILTANASKASSTSEINTRAGHHLEAVNPKTTLTVTHPDGYGWLVPSKRKWYTWTIEDSDNTRGRAYTTADRWLLKSVSVNHNNETGTKEVEAVYELETSGTPGQTPPPQPVTSNPITIPALPPFPTYPNLPGLVIDPGTGLMPPYLGPLTPFDNPPPKDGNTHLFWEADALYITREMVSSAEPTRIIITPELNEGESIKHAIWSGFGTDVYCLASDGTSSRVFYNQNAFDIDNLVSSVALSGIYTKLAVTETKGEVYAYGSAGSDDTCGIPPIIGGLPGRGTVTYLGGNQWQITSSSQSFSGHPFQGALIVGAIDTSCFEVTGFEVTGATLRNPYVALCDGTEIGFLSDLTGYCLSACDFSTNLDDDTPFTVIVTLCACAGDEQQIVSFSDDYAASFSVPQLVGSVAIPFGGFDTSKKGEQALASTNGQTYKASDGGSYTAYGDPKGQGAIRIPRHIFGSSSIANDDTDPEYLLFAAAEDGGETLWKVTDAGTTFTDITPTQGSDNGLAISPNCIDMSRKSGSRMACIGLYDTTRRLKVSTDAGASWTDRGAVGDDADYIRYRPGDTTLKQLFWVDGSDVKFTLDHGVNIKSRTLGEGTLLGVEPYG